MTNFTKIKKKTHSVLEFDLKKKLATMLLLVSMSQIQAHVSNVTNVTNYKIEQQQKTISGQVTDENAMPLPGATVMVKGTKNAVMTDFDGKFTLKINEGDKILIVSFVGYESTEIAIQNKSVFEINVRPSSEGLKEVVVVGFGTQKKASVVSSITTINPKELMGPTNNLTNMLAGRVSGMIAYQRSGEPGSDNSDFFIRGLGTFGAGKQNPLILIDNIESTSTDMARLQPDDIQSFSVLKDAAAAAVYGARGANGVVLIVTKQGTEGKTKFHFRPQYRVSSNVQNFNLADNISYMNLANEAALTRNPNAFLAYSRNKINRTLAGDDMYLYPNNNWIDELISDYTVNAAYNISASGGGEKAKYYISGTYNIDNGVLKVDPINNFNSNIKLRNYSIRSNVDINLTSTTTASVRLYGQFDDYNGPVGGFDRRGNRISGGQYIFNSALAANPVKFTKVYPSSQIPYLQHPLFGGAVAAIDGNNLLLNPYAEMVKGYETNKSSTIQT
ncbi:MAG: SusC/RagA family TonB-linked outer membrane protein, partial [Flavobacterium sp.]